MIEIHVTLEQHGPHIVTKLRAQTNPTSTVPEIRRSDEVCEMIIKMIGDKGGSATLITRKPPGFEHPGRG